MKNKQASIAAERPMAAVVKEARAALRGDVPDSEINEAPVDFSSLKNQSELEDSLYLLMNSTVTLPVDPVESGRPVIGPVITGAKRVLLRVLRPFLSMAMQNQVDLNENMAIHQKLLTDNAKHTLKELESLNERIDLLTREIKKLQDKSSG